MMHTHAVAIVGWPCANVIQQSRIYVPDIPKYVQAKVIEERINRGGGYGLQIPVSYHFCGHEKGVNWLNNRLVAIDKNLEKDIKHYLH